ncbi:hypothetical protein CVT25_000814 [Psilocybe cyanescens]|uniref:Uncharacterized protein n=1 Tax=Psilocybe cyanescens TaxID=93625 RepID=A0A409XXS6_PSICY|nr:hypothetical protein CVT25_000814 [Psilocybe cyanescens]
MGRDRTTEDIRVALAGDFVGGHRVPIVRELNTKDLHTKALAREDVRRQVLEKSGEISVFCMVSHVD